MESLITDSKWKTNEKSFWIVLIKPNNSFFHSLPHFSSASFITFCLWITLKIKTLTLLFFLKLSPYVISNEWKEKRNFSKRKRQLHEQHYTSPEHSGILCQRSRPQILTTYTMVIQISSRRNIFFSAPGLVRRVLTRFSTHASRVNCVVIAVDT